jgi:hypothetical protein
VINTDVLQSSELPSDWALDNEREQILIDLQHASDLKKKEVAKWPVLCRVMESLLSNEQKARCQQGA